MAFWRHSVGTGFVARTVAKKLQTESESAFLAGMLHDVGKLVLDSFFSEYYIEVVEKAKTSRTASRATTTHSMSGGISGLSA